MQIGQAWGTCQGMELQDAGDWMLGGGEATEMGAVVQEALWPHCGCQAGRQGLLGSIGSPLLLQVPGGVRWRSRA